MFSKYYLAKLLYKKDRAHQQWVRPPSNYMLVNIWSSLVILLRVFLGVMNNT